MSTKECPDLVGYDNLSDEKKRLHDSIKSKYKKEDGNINIDKMKKDGLEVPKTQVPGVDGPNENKSPLLQEDRASRTGAGVHGLASGETGYKVFPTGNKNSYLTTDSKGKPIK